MKIEHLANNQVIVHEGDKHTFVSYSTPVAVIENGHVTLRTGAFNDKSIYSHTTCKWLYRFLGSDRKTLMQGIKDGIISVANL